MDLFKRSNTDLFKRSDLDLATSVSENVDPEKRYPHAPPDTQSPTVAYVDHRGEPLEDDLPVVCPATTTEKRLVAKIDLRVLPFLCIMYLLAFLDRVNIGNAVTFNLTEDLGIGGSRISLYYDALIIFYVPYVLFEIPSNVLLRRFRPHVWLSANMFLFGLVSVCQGLVQSGSGLIATRFFLGLFETGMFPGSWYLIGMWYKRSEAQRRFSFFFSSTTLAGAFGGLLASAIGLMDGLEGYHAWRWIFILEGVLTCVVAIPFFFLLPDFPEEATWLSEDERFYVRARLQADQGKIAAPLKITLKDILNTFKDFKIFLGGFMYLGVGTAGYGFAYFAPTIIETYHYSPIETQLHSVAPWASAFVFAMIVAYLSDKTRHRFGFAVVCVLMSMTGFAMLIGLNFHNPHAEYAALFLIAMGNFSAMPIVVCWFVMNLGGHHRRAVGTAWQIGFGNIAGIIAVYAYRPDIPFYIPGYSVSLAFLGITLISSTAYYLACTWQNRKRDKAPVDVALSDYEKREMGDLSPDYRYLL